MPRDEDEKNECKTTMKIEALETKMLSQRDVDRTGVWKIRGNDPWH